MTNRRKTKRLSGANTALGKGGDSSLPIYRQPVFLLIVFFVGLATYLVLFFTAPLPSFGKDPQSNEFLFNRLEFLQALVTDIPTIIASWFGDAAAKVTPWDRVPVILVTALIFAAAYVVGRLAIELVGGDRGLSHLEMFVFAEGVGLNMLSLYTLAIGLLGGLRYLLVFTIPMAAVLTWAGIRWKRRWLLPTEEGSSSPDGLQNQAKKSNWLASYSLWLVVPFTAVILLGGMLPPVDFDVREYHLQTPKEWYQQGRVTFLPHNVYGNMPLGAEMHALLGMVVMQGERDWWWGALVGKTVMAMFAPLSALALFVFGRRFFSVTAGAVAAVVYISTPWIVRVSVGGLNEGALAFYLLLTCYAAMLWWHGKFDAEQSTAKTLRANLLLAGFFAGAAVACKYPAVVFVALPLIIGVPLCYFFSNKRKETDTLPPWQAIGLILLAVGAGCGLWFGKNAVLAGNPTYPLLYNVFGGKTRSVEKNSQWVQAHKVPPYSKDELNKAVQKIAWKSEWLSPLLLPLALLGLLVTRNRRFILLLAGLFFYVLVMWWLVTHRLDRFWLPALPLWALLAGMGSTWCDRRWWQVAIAIMLAGGLAINLLTVVSPHWRRGELDNRYFVSLDQLRRDEPIQPGGVSRVTAAHRYLNAHVPSGHRVLLVGDAQAFDLEGPTVYNTCFDDCIFEQWMKGRTKEERLATLRENKISHIYISWSDIYRYRRPGNYGFTDYVTPRLVHQEMMGEQQLLRLVEIDQPREIGELFEVVGVGSTKR